MTVTQFNLEPGLKFAAKTKRGDVRSFAFTIEGYSALQPHDWAAVARFRNGLDNITLSCVASLATVTVANDSVRITVTWTEAQANAFRLGKYVIDVKDHTTNQTWATGVLEVIRNSVP